ncbi:MAG: transglycosylase SLT domain-containing protein [Rhodocyclaceae bacterium]
MAERPTIHHGSALLWILLCSLLPGCATQQGVRGDQTKTAVAKRSAAASHGADTRSGTQLLTDPTISISKIDLTIPPKDLWVRIRNGFSMPDLDNELVTRQQAYYLNHPQYMTRIAERSRRYLHYIVEEIEKRGLPTELALLPMVESAFNPMAYSRARASGLWQFIPSTGRNYQLKQDSFVDQRRDIVASTGAALDYLETIYEMHGDWHLALASYNWGEAAVGRAIARNQAAGLPTDYMSLSMPAETRNYVPKLQALKNIVANAEALGVVLAPIPNRPYFTKVDKRADMDLALAARLAETPLEEFRALNPGFNGPVAVGQAHLVVPADKAEKFLSNLDSYDKPLVSWDSYTVQRNDRIDRIAATYGITSERLREINGIKPRGRVAIGRTLLVPANKEALPIAKTEPASPPGADTAYEVAADPDEKPAARGSRQSAKRVKIITRRGKRVVIVLRNRDDRPAVAGKAARAVAHAGHGKTAAKAGHGRSLAKGARTIQAAGAPKASSAKARPVAAKGTATAKPARAAKTSGAPKKAPASKGGKRKS